MKFVDASDKLAEHNKNKTKHNKKNFLNQYFINYTKQCLQVHNPFGLKTESKKKNENLRKKKRQREWELEEKEKQEEKSEERVAAIESKKRHAAAKATKKEKAPATFGSIINGAKIERHTRGLIYKHGETEFRRCRGGFLPSNW